MILDTNVYSALDKGTMSAVMALKGQAALGLPVNVIAELRFGFINGSKQAENESNLDKFLTQQAVSVLIPTIKTAETYATLAMYCRRAVDSGTRAGVGRNTCDIRSGLSGFCGYIWRQAGNHRRLDSFTINVDSKLWKAPVSCRIAI